MGMWGGRSGASDRQRGEKARIHKKPPRRPEEYRMSTSIIKRATANRRGKQARHSRATKTLVRNAATSTDAKRNVPPNGTAAGKRRAYAAASPRAP